MEDQHKYFCIHGHFYQPPRENPLTGWIEQQPSATPYHDWNERIYEQCYAPNTTSRVHDEKGRIKTVANNYAFMNFNIGPTLFSWIEEHHKRTYGLILEGDRASCERLEGHGNAMAQVYNHVILPLGSDRDRRLQIRWGIEDFQRRFGRKPEGMWLAETAINMDTVCALIREGIRFTVLSPTQAHKVRGLNSDGWQDVGQNNVDTRIPYRIFPVAENGTPLEKGWLDVFFYDMSLSSAVGFEHLLRDANRFADRIHSGFDPKRKDAQLVSVCTDGESYGHHEPFGDMCAAFLFSDLAPRLQMIPVSYAWFLHRFPPKHEVRLKNSDGEGTAWSCAHGVGRWKEDCGCSTGGRGDWNQKWRTPYRRAMDLIGRKAESILAEQGPLHFDAWDLAESSASNAWEIDSGIRQQWWARHLKPGANPAAARQLVDLLRFSQYIFTSCAWFFSDLTGLEAAQNLRYAHRCLRLIGKFTDEPLRAEFLGILGQAKSNLESKPGDRFYEDMEQDTLPLELHLALQEWVEGKLDPLLQRHRSKLWHCARKQNRTHNGCQMDEYGFTHSTTGERRQLLLLTEREWLDSEYLYYSTSQSEEIRSWLQELEQLDEESLKNFLPTAPLTRLSYKSLPPDIKAGLAFHLEKRYWMETEEEMLKQEQELMRARLQFDRIDWAPPSAIERKLNLVYNYRFVQELDKALDSGTVDGLQKALSLAKNLKERLVVPDLGPSRLKLSPFLRLIRRKMESDLGSTDLQVIFLLLDLVDTMDLQSERYRMQNLGFPLISLLENGAKQNAKSPNPARDTVLSLLKRLNFALEDDKKPLKKETADLN